MLQFIYNKIIINFLRYTIIGQKGQYKLSSLNKK